MTVYYGSVTGSDDGWTFHGKFCSEPGGVPKYAIVGGLNEPIKNLSVPKAELVNPEIKSYEYEGEIGLEHFSIRTTTLPQVIVVGHLGKPIRPTHVRGWLQVTPILRE